MRSLNEYLLSKHSKKASGMFPEKPVTKDIIAFLKRSGFADLHEEPETQVEIIDIFMRTANAGDRYLTLYAPSMGTVDICFAKDGPIHESNPVWCMTTSQDGTMQDDFGAGLSMYDYNSGDDTVQYKDYAELREAVAKHFEW